MVLGISAECSRWKSPRASEPSQLESAVSSVKGTARSMGVDVV